MTSALSKLAVVGNSSNSSKDAAKDPGRDEKQNTSLVDGDEEESEVVEEDEGLRGLPGPVSPKPITSALGMRTQPNLDSNQTTDIDLMPEDPNLNDTTASMSYRGRKLRDYLASNDAVMVRLAEEVENADTVEQMDAVRKAAKRIIFGVLNRVNDLLSICVADDAPMTLPFGEYASVMDHTLSKMLNVVKAAKRNDIKL